MENTTLDYTQFLRSKYLQTPAVGFADVCEADLNRHLFPFQRKVVAWALQRGRAAIFEDCGLGKTLQELDWARGVCDGTGGDVLILTPLAVAAQTVREAGKFGIEARSVTCQEEVRPGINVTNYEKLSRFDCSHFAGVVLDESSILKSLDGKTRGQLIESFSQTRYRLACTATPAPNDHMELGNHAEFLGVMSRSEMLATYFVHDGGDTAKWRLKGHAVDPFWKWVCSWAALLRRPSDLGGIDEGFVLPALNIHEHTLESEHDSAETGRLFAVGAQTLTERRNARRASLSGRVEATAELVNADREPWLVWCGLNDEGDALTAAIPDAVQISGSDTEAHKERAMLDFAEGKIRVLVSKPSICGFGLNFQNCARMAFVGLSDSYEQWYQAVRRCYRFGQTRDVDVHVFTSDAEGAVVANIKRKEADAKSMGDGMTKYLQQHGLQSVGAPDRERDAYSRVGDEGKTWKALRGDCVEILREQEAESVDYTIFSPPFSSLYTYSNSERDMGNCRSLDEFSEHFKFLARELFRLTKPGRLVSMHCFDIPAMKERDGFIGLFDFPSYLREALQDEGFIYHSKVCIWKDPVVQMQRTKALGLLHKQIRKDSAMSRQGLADYLVTMRKPGGNPEPIAHTHEEFPVEMWQRYASPVWMDINPSKTLQRESARAEQDERHICPLQLDVIERGIELWSNPGDVVLDPFGGIGSTGVVATRLGRRALLCELKESYFAQLTANMRQADIASQQLSIFHADTPEQAPLELAYA